MIIYQFIDNAVKEGNILVHCGAGISRSSTMAIAWLIKTRKKPFEDMLALVQSKRPICHPNSGFQAQLLKWEKKVLS